MDPPKPIILQTGLWRCPPPQLNVHCTACFNAFPLAASRPCTAQLVSMRSHCSLPRKVLAAPEPLRRAALVGGAAGEEHEQPPLLPPLSRSDSRSDPRPRCKPPLPLEVFLSATEQWRLKSLPPPSCSGRRPGQARRRPVRRGRGSEERSGRSAPACCSTTRSTSWQRCESGRRRLLLHLPKTTCRRHRRRRRRNRRPLIEGRMMRKPGRAQPFRCIQGPLPYSPTALFALTSPLAHDLFCQLLLPSTACHASQLLRNTCQGVPAPDLTAGADAAVGRQHRAGTEV